MNTLQQNGHGEEQSLSKLISSDRVRSAIAAVIPRHLTPERIIRVAQSATSRNTTLLKCTPSSFITSVVQAAELGLEPGGALGHAYLVPFRNGETGQYECQMIPGYRGLISLARRSGEILSIEAHVIYLRDKWKRMQGTEPVFSHEPWAPEYNERGEIQGYQTPGPMIAVYAVAKLKGGGTQVEFMHRHDVEKIRMRSPKGRKSEGPWKDDYEEMSRKTVVRRLFKYLPVSIELASALDHLITVDGEAEIVDDTAPAAALEDGSIRIDDGFAQPRTEGVKEKITRKRKEQAQPTAAPVEAAPAPPEVQEQPTREPGEDDDSDVAVAAFVQQWLRSPAAQQAQSLIANAATPIELASAKSYFTQALLQRKITQGEGVELQRQITAAEASFAAE
jgi:recombination protein RecT